MNIVNLQGTKSTYKKPIVFLYTKNELAEREIKKIPQSQQKE